MSRSSTVVGGTVDINNERLDKFLQTPKNKYAEQVSRDDQPNNPAATSGHLEAGSLNLGGHRADEPHLTPATLATGFGLAESSSHHDLAQYTVPRQQAKRERKRRRLYQYIRGNWLVIRTRYSQFLSILWTSGTGLLMEKP